MKLTDEQIDQILDAYLECAMWTDEETLKEACEEIDLNIDNVDQKSKYLALRDISLFLHSVGGAIENISMGQIGHDLWLTRNIRGVGFWDSYYSEENSDILTKVACNLGTQHIYVGEDNKLYLD